jgi:hypothetical protein
MKRYLLPTLGGLLFLAVRPLRWFRQKHPPRRLKPLPCLTRAGR